jgi:hypothetical protein
MLRITLGGLGSFGLKAIRNRQVASSTLALGSNIPLEDKDLADSLNRLCPIRCKVVTNSEVFAQRIHRAHLEDWARGRPAGVAGKNAGGSAGFP